MSEWLIEDWIGLHWKDSSAIDIHLVYRRWVRYIVPAKPNAALWMRIISIRRYPIETNNKSIAHRSLLNTSFSNAYLHGEAGPGVVTTCSGLSATKPPCCNEELEPMHTLMSFKLLLLFLITHLSKMNPSSNSSQYQQGNVGFRIDNQGIESSRSNPQTYIDDKADKMSKYSTISSLLVRSNPCPHRPYHIASNTYWKEKRKGGENRRSDQILIITSDLKL